MSNKVKVYLLPATTTTRAHRIAEAKTRHHINTAGTWTVEKNGDIMPPIHLQSGEQRYITADKAVYFALRAREEKSGVDLFRELAMSAPADRQRRELTRIATEAIEAQREHDRQRAKAEAMTAIYNSTKATPAERLSAYEVAKTAKTKADKALKRMQELESHITKGSFSDREQLVQVAVMASFDPITEADPAQAFRHMTNSAGRAIATLASPDALRSTRTKLTAITTAEAIRELEAHPNIDTVNPFTGEETTTPAKVPFNVKGGGTVAGYYTIEYREATKTRPAGYYRVSHYHTVAPYISYETFATGDGAEAIAKNNGINLIDSISALEEVEAIVNRANLTEREREVVLKLIDNTARHHAELAHREAMEQGRERIAEAPANLRARERKRATKRAESAYNKALWDSAFTRAGIYAQSTRSTMQTRITARLAKAKSDPAEQTPAELEARERRAWESLQRNSHRESGAVEHDRIDVLQIWLDLAEQTKAPKPVVRWTAPAEREYTAEAPAETLSPCGIMATPPKRTEREEREYKAVCERLADFEAKYQRIVEQYGEAPADFDPKRASAEALAIRLKIEALTK